MTADTIINLVTLFTAGTAALIGWFNLRSEGASKVAEYRKEWIENLRTHLAKFQGELVVDRKNINVSQIAYLSSYIDLCLNIDEIEHARLGKIKGDIALLAVREGRFDPDMLEQFTDAARSVLKREWDRLKRETTSGWQFWRKSK